jgi:SAM-dependent methyltransferase
MPTRSKRFSAGLLQYRLAAGMVFALSAAMDFYLDTARQLGMRDDESVLVVCGGRYDQRTLEAIGIKSAVISNVSPHQGVKTYGSYAWEFQDAEDITRPDRSFDWVIVHAGLHHCASPHRAFCEMLRVARKGVLVIESRDSFVLGIAKRFGLVPDFELEPALLSGGKSGGYRDTPIPNYIYRWTEREVEKTVASFDPAHRNVIEYHYGWRLPMQRIAMAKNPFVRAVVKMADAGKWLFEKLLPRQGNCFGIVVRKTGELQPWMKQSADELLPDLDFIGARYDRDKYGNKVA